MILTTVMVNNMQISPVYQTLAIQEICVSRSLLLFLVSSWDLLPIRKNVEYSTPFPVMLLMSSASVSVFSNAHDPTSTVEGCK